MLAPELAAAFERFMHEPARTDKGCAAKTAIAVALVRLGSEDERLFRAGIRHVQREPVFGGRVDTAVDLRGACAMGLVNTGSRTALVELADLLADPEPPARISAARALAVLGSEAAMALLRLRVLAGDPEPRVLTECLLALLRAAPESSLGLAQKLLEAAEGSVAEAAALALGESRLVGAFPLLRDWLGRAGGGERRRTALAAIVLLRRDEAIDFLCSLIAEGTPTQAREALEALSMQRGSPELRRKTLAAVEQRAEPSLREALARAFGDN